MLKKITNEAYFTLRITTTGPLLIKSGHASISGPDMTPVLTFRNGKQEAFIPGSSLKGVFRSHLEKIICSLKSQVVCYPFAGSESERHESDIAQRQHDYRNSCGDTFNKRAKNNDDERKLLEERTDVVYAESCPACRLFGSTSFIGRVAISDAYLASDSKEIKELRDGVGIDRLTGGASHGAKFELEVVSTGVTFETTIHLRNFESWQLGMLFVVLQDMEDSLIRIGSGRSRGLGMVVASIKEQDQLGGVTTSTLRGMEDGAKQHELWGLGRWLNDSSYGTWQDDLLRLPLPEQQPPHGIRTTRAFTGTALTTLRDAAIENFVQRIQQWPPASVADVRGTAKR